LDLSFCVSQLRIAFPFVFIGVFFILDNRMDVILLSILRGEQDVGLYSAAATIVTGLAMVPEGFRTAIYPILARYQAQSTEATRRLYARSFKYLLLLAVPMALGVTLTADEAIHVIYGSAFAPAGWVLRILAWSLLAFSLTVLNGRLLIVNDRQDLMARFLMVSATSNLVLNILLVPTAGAVGSALAKVVSSTMLLLLSQGAAMRLLSGFSPSGFIGRPLIAGIIMGGLVWLLRPWGLVIQIPAGAIAYVATLLALRTFPREEQALWQRALLQLRQQEALDE
jgi:O-antigen/teichoic acid export membrane protein